MNHYLLTVFCDDIREEVGGKLSLIGVYNGLMFVPQFPVTIPKLCIAATLVFSADKPPKSLKIRVWKDSKAFALLDANTHYLEQLAKAREPLVPMPSGTQRMGTSFAQVCFAQLEIEKPCFLRVTALTEHGEVRSIGLQIAPQVTAAAG